MNSEDFGQIAAEMIAHVPLFLHPAPRKILVLGDPDGSTAREILRHTSIDRCVRAFKECNGDSLTWAKLAAEKVRNKARDAEKFDVICVDEQPNERAQELYSDLATILAEQGVVVSKAGSPFYALEKQSNFANLLKLFFKRVHLYNYTSPLIDGGLASISFVSDSIHPLDGFSPSKVASSDLAFRYYNIGVHESAFLLPEFQKKQLTEQLNPL